jgi:hypothetical protein
MPEYQEPHIHAVTAKYIWEPLKFSHDWQMLGIWADGTDAEQKLASDTVNLRLKLGLVYPLDEDSHIQRGNSGAQGYVWPHLGDLSGDDDLRLQAMECHARSMRLNFGPWVLQVSVCSFVIEIRDYNKEKFYRCNTLPTLRSNGSRESFGRNR